MLWGQEWVIIIVSGNGKIIIFCSWLGQIYVICNMCLSSQAWGALEGWCKHKNVQLYERGRWRLILQRINSWNVCGHIKACTQWLQEQIFHVLYLCYFGFACEREGWMQISGCVRREFYCWLSFKGSTKNCLFSTWAPNFTNLEGT